MAARGRKATREASLRGASVVSWRCFMDPSAKALVDSYGSLAEEFKDFSRSMFAMSREMATETRSVFAQKGAPLVGYKGTPWTQLTTKYALYGKRGGLSSDTKRAMGFGGNRMTDRTPTNVKTGQLFSKLRSNSAFKIQKMFVLQSVSLPYAKAVQWSLIGGRPYLGATPRLKDVFNKLVHEELGQKLDRFYRKLEHSKAA